MDWYLKELRALGCKDVLVLGGGGAEPAGSLHETMQILESGLLQTHGFETVGVAAHPEGEYHRWWWWWWRWWRCSLRTVVSAEERQLGTHVSEERLLTCSRKAQLGCTY